MCQAEPIFSSDRICAVVVTFNPSLEDLQRQMDALGSQVGQVVIVDNGSAAGCSSQLKELSNLADRTHLISLDENRGVAYAQNTGIEWARSRLFGYVLLMDQDSVPYPDMIRLLFRAMIEAGSSDGKIGAIGPRLIDSDSGRLSQHVRLKRLGIGRIECGPDQPFVEVDFLVSSGSLVPLAVLQDVGQMDSSLFIDHIDTEWCFRAMHKGYRILGHCDARMTHSLGERRKRIWLGRWRDVPLHKPFRYFYLFRNSVILYKRSYMPLQWKVVDAIRLVKMFVLFGILAPGRLSRMKMMIKGLLAGVRAKSADFS